MTPAELKKRIGSRQVYIWGTRIAGLSAIDRLEKDIGVPVTALVDSVPISGKKHGHSVLLPAQLFKKNDPFVIICTRGHSAQVSDTCRQHNVPFVLWEEIQRFDYYIEVNNRCNLNCISCSVREYYNDPLRNMSVPDFTKVLERIRDQDPFCSWINLYGHNEPLLSDTLPEMVRVADRMGFAVGISTNLATIRNFEDVIKAGPMFVRVSVSGWGNTYEKVHQNAKFPVLLHNLSLLQMYRAKYCPGMEVEVFFHRYKHNNTDREKVRELCARLGFEYREIYASIIGFETVSNILDHRPVSMKIQRAIPLLCHTVEETSARAYKQRQMPCPNDHMVRVHSDLSVAACLAWMGSKIPDTTFLEIPYDELEHRLTATPLCHLCRPRGLHQFCEIVFDEVPE